LAAAEPMKAGWVYERLLTWLFVAICVVIIGYLAYVAHIIFRWF
jgi:hypothetical protein